MILYVIGNKGAGKTLFLTAWGVLNHLNGAQIYATYSIEGIKCKPIKTLDDLEQFNEDSPPSVVLLDEGWILGLDSRSPMSLQNKLMSIWTAQSRKKNIDVLISSQTKDFGVNDRLDSRTRDVVDFVLYPSITSRAGGDPEGAPLIITAEVYDEDHKHMGRWALPMKIGRYNIPFIYNTRQEVVQMTSPAVEMRRRLFIKYWEMKDQFTTKDEMLNAMLYDEEKAVITKAAAVECAKVIEGCMNGNALPKFYVELRKLGTTNLLMSETPKKIRSKKTAPLYTKAVPTLAEATPQNNHNISTNVNNTSKIKKAL